MLRYSLTNPKTHNLGVKCRVLESNLSPPITQSRGVVMVVENEFQSQPSPTIHYTYNKILEGLRSCELPQSVQTHSILVSKVENRLANFSAIRD